MPAIQSVNEGEITYDEFDGASPSAINVGALTDFPIARSIVMFSHSHNDPIRANKSSWSAVLQVNGANLEVAFTRNESSNADDSNIAWVVYAFESSALNQDVIRGVKDCDTQAQTVDIGVVVDEDATMVIASSKTSETAWSAYAFQFTTELTADVASMDEITFNHNATPSLGESVIAWQVVEFNTADIYCEHGITVYQKAGANQAISGFVTEGNMFALTTGLTRGNGSGVRWLSRVKINSTTQIQINPQNFGSGVNEDMSWTVCEFLDGGVVEQGEVTFADTDGSETSSFTALAVDKSGFIVVSNLANAFCTSTSTDSSINAGACRMVLDGDRAGLTITRVDTTEAFEFGWVAVEWAAAAGGGSFDETVSFAVASSAAALTNAIFAANASLAMGAAGTPVPAVTFEGLSALTLNAAHVVVPNAVFQGSTLLAMTAAQVSVANAVFEVLSAMNVTAIQGDGADATMEALSSLAGQASLSVTPNAVYTVTQTLSMVALISWLEIITKEGAIGLSVSSSSTSTSTATVNALTTLIGQMAMPASTILQASPPIALTVGSSVVWVDSLAGIVEVLALALGSSMSPSVQATINALTALIGQMAMPADATLQAFPPIALSVGSSVVWVDSLEAIEELLALAMSGSMSPSALASFETDLTLALNASLDAQLQATVNALIDLGVNATMARVAGLALLEAVTFNIQSTLVLAGSVSSPDIGTILIRLAEQLRTNDPAGTLSTIDPSGTLDT